MLVAILSAVCVESSSWSVKERDLIMKTLAAELEKIPDSKYEFYRRDNFQLNGSYWFSYSRKIHSSL